VGAVVAGVAVSGPGGVGGEAAAAVAAVGVLFHHLSFLQGCQVLCQFCRPLNKYSTSFHIFLLPYAKLQNSGLQMCSENTRCGERPQYWSMVCLRKRG